MADRTRFVPYALVSRGGADWPRHFPTTERGTGAILLRTRSRSRGAPGADRGPAPLSTGAIGAPARGPDPSPAARAPTHDPDPAGLVTLPSRIERPTPARPEDRGAGRDTRRASPAGRDPAASPARLRGADQVDRLRPYRPLVTMVRWGTVLVGVVLTASDPTPSTAEVVLAILLVVHAGVRTVWPARWVGSTRGAIPTLIETAACYLAVAATGWWSSPFVFTVIPGLVQAGFAGGFAWAVPLAAVASAAVTIPSFKNTDATIQLATQGSAEYLLAAMVAGYGRRLFGEAEERTGKEQTRGCRIDEDEGDRCPNS